MTDRADLVIVGGGPAGIATAIAAGQRGLAVIVVDARIPPIDKSCGEGVLPQGVAALASLGIRLNSNIAVPFAGIRFADEESAVCARFPGEAGFGIRRTQLHKLLVERATQMGVRFLWGKRITELNVKSITAGGENISYSWLAGADGRNSIVRRWAGLEPRRAGRKRFGFRQHFRTARRSSIVPNVVDVHWGRHCQLLTTPTGPEEVCVIACSRDPHLRLRRVLPHFPAVSEILGNATPVTQESGETIHAIRIPAVTRGRVALVGDASGTVDAITGDGLSLSFQQAIALAEAFERGKLAAYETVHRRISVTPVLMSHLLLMMEKSGWVRRKVFHLLQSTPGLFAKLLAIHSGALPISSVGPGEMAGLGWKLLRA